MFGCCWLKDQLISWVTSKNRVICISYLFCQNLAIFWGGLTKQSWERTITKEDELASGNIFQRSVALCSKIDQHGARFPPVSHMGHYASLAQKSMDCFVLVTAPFHFTSGGACAPPKHSATWAGVAGGIHKYQCFWSVCSHSWDEDFETSTSQPRPIAAGTVSWQNQDPTDTANVFPVK